MKKLFYIVLLTLPLTVTAVPRDVPVNAIVYTFSGNDATGFTVYCNTNPGVDIPDADIRLIMIADLGLGDGNYTCDMTAYNDVGENPGRSESVNFTLSGGEATALLEVPAVPTGIGVKWIK